MSVPSSTLPFFFVFDLDETLAEVYPLFDVLEDALTRRRSPPTYRALVRRIAADGTSAAARGMGILRPGIRETMHRLHDLQRKGLVGGVLIYSNNGHLRSLQFIRDVIHAFLEATERPLIVECIHWNHPRRTDAPQRNDKTWESLRRFLPDDIPASRVFFVDDLDHPDLHAALGDHYLQVPPYEYHIPLDTLLDIYDEALHDAGQPRLTEKDREGFHRLMDQAKAKEHTEAKHTEEQAKENQVDPIFQQLMDRALAEVEQGQQGGAKKRKTSKTSKTRSRSKRRKHLMRRTKKARLNRE